MSDRLHKLAATAVLQRATWGDRTVDVPLARPLAVEPEEIALELADGTALVLAAPGTASQARADLRRWWATHGDGGLIAVIELPDDQRAALRDAAPERPGPSARFVLLEDEPLWGDPEPGAVRLLRAAAAPRGAPPSDVLDRLIRRLDRPWPPRAAPPPTPRFERIVFALAQAHDLVKLIRGHARLRLRGGGGLTVLAGSGDASVDDAALAAALAEILCDADVDARDPGLLVVDGPEDLLDRAREVLGGRPVRDGRVNSVGAGRAVRPPDRDLSDLVDLADAHRGPIELWTCLEVGLARARGLGLERQAAGAGESRIGLVGALLDALPNARLRWLEPTSARINVEDREVRVRWVGPEGAPVDEVVASWRLAATAARWTGHPIDLVLAGGDLDTWQRARRALPRSPEGHVFHLDGGGRVRARAGLLGPALGVARALRAAARLPAQARRRTLDDLKRQLERTAVDDFRTLVADADFTRKLFAAPPWATRTLALAIVAGYALQWRWDAFSGPGAVRAGALTGDTLVALEPWRWLSAAFLHAGIWHIALNAWALWILGRRIEALIGPSRMAILFLLSCVGGSLLHETFSRPGDIAVGASTGILGLLGAQAALVMTRPDLTPPRIRRLLWREAWVNGLIILAISLLPFVGGLAHLGGAIAGFFLIATGLLTVGVAAGDRATPGPTQISEPGGLRAAAVGLAGLALACVAYAAVTGTPWILGTAEGRVRDVSFDGGALTVPLPGSAPPPDRRVLPDGTRVVVGGDALRDGLTVHARARPAGLSDAIDLDAVLALRGPARAEWQRGIRGDGPVAWSMPSGGASLLELLAPEDRLVRRTFIAVRDGVVFHVDVTGTADVVPSRLSGTWDRVPAGLAAHADAWPDLPPAADLLAFEALVAGADLPSLDGLPSSISGVLRLAALLREGTGPSPAGAPVDPDRARAVAAALAGRGATGLALDLLAVGAIGIDPDELAFTRALALDEARRHADALAELRAAPTPPPTLYEAQLLWHLGDPAARALARRWLDEGEPWWARAIGAERALSPAWLGNRAWGRLLADDAPGCVADSRAALQREPDLVFARYNLGLCLLVTGAPADAATAYRRAEADARVLASPSLRRAAARDLLRLIADEVPGARQQYRDAFADLAPLPGYGTPEP